MKRFLSLLLIVCLILSLAALAGCGRKIPVPAAPAGSGSAPAASSSDSSSGGEQPASGNPVGALPLSSFTATVGSYELTFEPIDLGGVEGSESTHEFTGDYYKGKYYLSDEGSKKVYVYSIDGTAATLDSSYDYDKGFEKITVNHDGCVLLSQGIFEAYELLPNGTFEELPFKHDLECSKLEDFAVITWVNADPTVIHDGVEGEWVFKNINNDEERVGPLSMVFDCEIAGKDVLIGGTYVENGESNYRIGIFDYDGNQLKMTDVGDPVGYSALNETDNGIISANVNRLYLHDSDCKPIGKIDSVSELTDFNDKVSTFWINDFAVGDDGEIYMLVYTTKTDDTHEALLYKVTGF